MGDLTVRVSAEKLIKKVRRAPKQLQRDVQKVVVDAINDITTEAKQLCPYRTGNLRRSITPLYDTDYLGGYVTAYAPYADFVEFGTSKMKAQPYLYPAFEDVYPKYIKNLEKALKAVLKND